MGQNTTEKASPTHPTILTATPERGKDGKLKYLLRQDLFVPPSLSKPNCRHPKIGLIHTVLVIQQFCKYWIFAGRAAHCSSPDGHSQAISEIQIMLYQILEQLQPPQAPCPKLTWQGHSELTAHLMSVWRRSITKIKIFHSMDTQQLSTVEFVVVSQANCPFPCLLYLDDKSSGNRSTAAPPPTPQGTLFF